MKSHLLVLAIAAAGLSVPSDADARDRRGGTDVRISFGQDRPWSADIRHSDRHRPGRDRCDARRPSWRHHDQPVCNHRNARQLTEQIWVPATVRSVVVGYSHCGEPRYGRVRVPGHWDTVVTGHRCGDCGSSW